MLHAFDDIQFGEETRKVKPDWRRFIFETVSSLEFVSIAAKTENERNLAIHLKESIAYLDANDDVTNFLRETEAQNLKDPRTNSLFYSLLSRVCKGRPLDIVRSFESTRSGAHAFAKLKERFKEETHTKYLDIFGFPWKSSSPIEDKFRNFVQLVSRLGQSLPDAAMEAIIINGLKSSGNQALEYHLRLHSPQSWENLVQCVEKYICTLRTNDDRAPMDIGAVEGSEVFSDPGSAYESDDCYADDDDDDMYDCNAIGNYGRSQSLPRTNFGRGNFQSSPRCQSCNGTGHTRDNCKFRNTKCLYCHKTGHIARACKKKTHSMNQNRSRSSSSLPPRFGGKGNNYNSNFSGKGNNPKCHGCGENHQRTSCPHKDKICSACGKKGHLQRVCKSRGKGANAVTFSTEDAPEQNNSEQCMVLEWSSSGEEQNQILQISPTNIFKWEIEELYEYEDWVNINTPSDFCEPEPEHIFNVGAPLDFRDQFSQRKNIPFLIDSGADCHIIPHSIWNNLKRKHPLRPSDLKLVSASGDKLNVEGVTKLQLYAQGSRVVMDTIVSENVRRPILSCPRLTRMGYTIELSPEKSILKGKDGRIIPLDVDHHGRTILNASVSMVCDLVNENACSTLSPPTPKNLCVDGIRETQVRREVERLKQDFQRLKSGTLPADTPAPEPPWSAATKLVHERAGHIPYNKNCDVCVKNAGVHRHEAGVPSTSAHFDFCEIEFSRQDGQGNLSITKATVLVGAGPEYESYARFVGAKGQIPRSLREFMAMLYARYGKGVTIRGDPEHPLRYTLEQVAENTKLSFVATTVEDKRNNGRGERQVRKVKELFGTLRSDLEKSHDLKLPANHSIYMYLMRHTEWILNNMVRRPYILPNSETMVHLSVFEAQTGMRPVQVRTAKFCEEIYVLRRNKDPKDTRYLKVYFLGIREKDVVCLTTAGEVRIFGFWRFIPPQPFNPRYEPKRKATFISAIGRMRLLQYKHPGCGACNGTALVHSEERRIRLVDHGLPDTYWKDIVQPFSDIAPRRGKRIRSNAAPTLNPKMARLADSDLLVPARDDIENTVVPLRDIPASSNAPPPGYVPRVDPTTPIDLESTSEEKSVPVPMEVQPSKRERPEGSDPNIMTDAPPQEFPSPEKRSKIDLVAQEALEALQISVEENKLKALSDASSLLHTSEPPVVVGVKQLPPCTLEQAKSNEIEKLREMGTFEEVFLSPSDPKPLSGRWVITEKSPDVFKARYVIRGFEEPTDSEEQTFSPTTSLVSIKTTLGYSLANNLFTAVLDISGAFLNAPIQDSAIIVAPPEEYVPSLSNTKPVFWKLKKSLYGLRSSPVRWNEFLSNIFDDLNFETNPIDTCMRKKNSTVLVYHVDDILITGREKDVRSVIGELQNKLDLKWSAVTQKPIRFLGRNLSRENDYFIFTLPDDYVTKALADFGLENLSPLKCLTYNYDTTVDTEFGEKEENDDPAPVTIGYPDYGEYKALEAINQVIICSAETDESFLPSKSPELKKISFKKSKRAPPDEEKGEMNETMQRNFRQLLGRLLWMEHPSSRAVTILLATRAGRATPIDWRNIVNAFRFLLSQPIEQRICGVEFKYPICERSPIGSIYIQSDSSWGLPGHMCRRSLSGGIIYIKISPTHFVLLSCICKKQSAVSLSSMEAETAALVLNSVEGLGIYNLAHMLFPQNDRQIIISTDISSALMLAQRKGAGRRSRHLDVRLFYIQQLNNDPKVKYTRVPGDQNISDLFTKIHSHPPNWMMLKLGFIPK